MTMHVLNRKRIFNKEQAKEAGGMWVAGSTVRAISEIFDVDIDSLKRFIRENRDLFPKRQTNNPTPVFTPDQIDLAAKMWGEGSTITNICKALNTHYNIGMRIVRSDPDKFPARTPPKSVDQQLEDALAASAGIDDVLIARLKAGKETKAAIRKDIGWTPPVFEAFLRKHKLAYSWPLPSQTLGCADIAVVPVGLPARGAPVHIADVRENECRFIEGEDGVCCGKAVAPPCRKGKRPVRHAYCQEHLKLVLGGCDA